MNAQLRNPVRALIALSLTALWAGACSRTGLEVAIDELDGGFDPTAVAVDLADAADDGAGPFTATSGGCSPTEEECNGVDDDCDGEVDEGLASIPCPGGGSRYCVGGKMSACPRRCERCLPGSEQVCFVTYCTYWGIQTCTADGRSFSRCEEIRVPRECEDVAENHRNSPELEQCCLDHGYCCVDEHDLDHDGNRSELLGRCDEVLCEL